VCLDELHGVGVFVEVEQLVPDDVPGEAVQAELARFVASLDVEAERSTQTYDSLVRDALAST
jgi:adenylate cyclase, class 2